MAYKIDIPEDEYKQSWSYTPGSAVQDNYNGTYTTSGGLTFKNNYTTDKITPEMSYAIKQTGGDPNGIKAADKYAEDLLGRVGSVSANTGKVLSLEDIQNELTRLGYQVSNNGDWTNVGGAAFLTGGEDYDYLKDFYAKQGLGNVNIYTGQGLPGYAGYTGGASAGSAGSYGGGVNYAGVDGYSSYVDAYMQALQEQLDYIDQQKQLAADEAARQKRQAYVAMKLGQKALNEQNAAGGLQDSGYSESSNIALSADYGNNLNTIGQNYQNYLNDLTGTYTNTALSGAGTVADLQRQAEQDAFARQQYADKLAQQQWENQFAEKQYADSLAQQQLQNQLYQSENDLSLAKTRADAARSIGLWTPDVQTVYGLTQEQFNNYLAAQQAEVKKNSNVSAGNGGSNVNNVYTTNNDGHIDAPPTLPAGARVSAGAVKGVSNAASTVPSTTATASTVQDDKSVWDKIKDWYNTREAELAYDNSTDGRAAILAKNFALDDATAIGIINAADKAGVSYGEAYKQYILLNGTESEKRNADALAKRVDMYVKRY